MSADNIRAKAAEAQNRARAITAKYEGKPPATWLAEDRDNLTAAVAEISKFANEAASVEQADAALQSLVKLSEPEPPVRTSRQATAQPETLDSKPNSVYGLLPQTPEFKAAHRAAMREILCAPPGLAQTRASSILAQSGCGPEVERLVLSGGTSAHAHTTQVDSLGGFLTTPELMGELIRDSALPGTVSNMVRTVTTGRNPLVAMRMVAGTGTHGSSYQYPSGFSGARRAENETTGGTAPTVQNQPTWGRVSIPIYRWQPNAIELPEELIDDSEINLEQTLAEVIGETLTVDKDWEVLYGTGVGMASGILVDGNLVTVPSTHATLLTYSGLMNLYTGLPIQYRQNAQFCMSSATYGSLLQTESSGGFVLFPANSLPGTLWGKPIAFCELMPAIGAGTEPILFGDFQRSYYLAMRRELRITRLVERFAPNVAILASMRWGGAMVQPASMRAQTISA